MVRTANNEGNTQTEWTTIKVPKVLMERIEELLKAKGYVNRSEYVRIAIQRQLALDEGQTRRKT